MNLLPVVNTEVKMPKKMHNALALFETYCAVSGIETVTYQQTIDYLKKHNGIELSQFFKPEYLFSNQVFSEDQK
jgi:hypothetical protein